MKSEMNRKISYVIIFIVYALASIGGIIVFNALGFELWLNLLIADVCATVITFVFSILFSNASVYDPYWSVQPMVICLALALKGTRLTAMIMVLCVCVWGVRLTLN